MCHCVPLGAYEAVRQCSPEGNHCSCYRMFCRGTCCTHTTVLDRNFAVAGSRSSDLQSCHCLERSSSRTAGREHCGCCSRCEWHCPDLGGRQCRGRGTWLGREASPRWLTAVSTSTRSSSMRPKFWIG